MKTYQYGKYTLNQLPNSTGDFKKTLVSWMEGGKHYRAILDYGQMITDNPEEWLNKYIDDAGQEKRKEGELIQLQFDYDLRLVCKSRPLPFADNEKVELFFVENDESGTIVLEVRRASK